MRLGTLLLVMLLALSFSASTAGAGGGFGTVAPGVCPNPGAPDDDGDGIPNGQDPDYIAPRDGTGNQWHRGMGVTVESMWHMAYVFGPFGLVNLSGYTAPSLGGGGYGPGDCTGNGGIGPRDGTGFGPGPRR